MSQSRTITITCAQTARERVAHGWVNANASARVTGFKRSDEMSAAILLQESKPAVITWMDTLQDFTQVHGPAWTAATSMTQRWKDVRMRSLTAL